MPKEEASKRPLLRAPQSATYLEELYFFLSNFKIKKGLADSVRRSVFAINPIPRALPKPAKWFVSTNLIRTIQIPEYDSGMSSEGPVR